MARCLIEPLSQGGEPCAHVFRQGDQGAYRHQGEITIRPNLTSRNDPRVNAKLRVPVERDHGFRWKMITQSGGT